MNQNTFHARATDPENVEIQIKTLVCLYENVNKELAQRTKAAILNNLPFNLQFAVALLDHVENVKKGIINR